MTADPQRAIESLSFEAALEELDSLIGKLEAGSIALDDAIAVYERATALAHHCEALLDRTERRVTALVVSGDGRQSETPLQVERDPAPPPPRAEPGLFGDEPPRARRPRVDPDDVPF